MKRLLAIILILGLAHTVWAGRQGDISRQRGDGSVPTGGDLFPWPRGTEILFPWETISGQYAVVPFKAKTYAGHHLQFWVTYEGPENRPILGVSQYDRNGRLYALGKGVAEGVSRIIKVEMAPKAPRKRPYLLLVRAYEDTAQPASAEEPVVIAVTFCPRGGKKCLQDANYTLDRMKH